MIKPNKNQENGEFNTSVFKLVNRPSMVDSAYTPVIRTISHELRNPVSILKSNIQILRMFSYEVDQELKEESLSMCEESIDNIVRFLDDIQLLNSAGRTDINTEISEFRVKRIMENQLVELAKQGLDCERLTVKWDLAANTISSDLKFIQRIAFNLLSNALKFSREEVKANFTINREKLIITVSDFGIGIPEEDTELIFKPFYRSQNVKRIPGLGLGLAVVSTLSKSLRGEIYISSVPESGTAVKIILPVDVVN
jgi:signal transduction histidine kinase